jgi:hypothetical protein
MYEQLGLKDSFEMKLLVLFISLRPIGPLIYTNTRQCEHKPIIRHTQIVRGMNDRVLDRTGCNSLKVNCPTLFHGLLSYHEADNGSPDLIISSKFLTPPHSNSYLLTHSKYK